VSRFKNPFNDDERNIKDISVILLTADREQLLHRTVDSVLKHSVSPSKIFAVDNIFEKLNIQFDDPRVVIVRVAPRRKILIVFEV